MIKEITMFEFDSFVNNHIYGSFYESSNYAILSSEEGYDYDYIGYFKNNILVAASLVLIKRISLNTKYGYAPRGFVIDYNDNILVQEFTNALSLYYKKKLVFIKINPLVIKNNYDYKYNLIWQNNSNIVDKLSNMGFKKLKDNLYFESQLPRYDAIIKLPEFDLNNICKNARNKINKALKKGLSIEKVGIEGLNTFYKYIKNKDKRTLKYYNDLYRVFSKNDCIDLFLVKINYEKLMSNAKESYDIELIKNAEYNHMLKSNNSNRNLNKKLNSDKLIINYKNDILKASRKYTDNELEEYIAGAMVIKHNKRVTILYSGYDKMYSYLNANYFLHYSLIQHYKKDFEYLSLNGFTGDFSSENKYYGLNKFKLSFKPFICEYIGEFDLIINQKNYNNLLGKGILHKEFDLK